ncbi:MAG: PadR family transcriptional regulator [Christensenellaceae bacterium]|nr:PadR family transcriptional regulator [Christensenellaceae bacterium]
MNIDKARQRYIPMSETMLYILLSLREERHGYGIMQHVKELTNGRIVLGAGTVYQSLGKLEADGLIRAVREEDRKKYYVITPQGAQILSEEAARIREVYRHLEGIK